MIAVAVGSVFPSSHFAIADWLKPVLRASCIWLKLLFILNSFNLSLNSVRVEDDIIVTTGNPTLWIESVDKGETWVEVSANEATEEEKHYILFTPNFRLKKRDFFGKT